jgi:hypothetical protein
MAAKKGAVRKVEAGISYRGGLKNVAQERRGTEPNKITAEDLPPNENIKKGADEVYGDMQLPVTVRRKPKQKG